MNDEQRRRIAENETVWRQINELAPPEPGAFNTVFCECGQAGCAEPIQITAPEYEEAREASTTFIVRPGHEILDVEDVIGRTDRFVLVEKRGEAAAVAIENDD